MLTYGSVCSGIEAATVAWEPLGWKPAWFSEIDKFPSAVLAHHYPNIPNLGDMLRLKQRSEYLERAINLLVGGTPCQSFSLAGLRKGLDDERGNLALEFCRILLCRQPRWFIWENVPGVLSSTDNRDFASILSGFRECGYGFAYRVLDAQYFGLAQRRKRVFVVGYLGDWRPAAAVLFERQSVRGYPAPCRETGQAVAALTSNRVGTCGADDNQGQAGHLIHVDIPDVAWALQERDAKGADSDTKEGHLLPMAFSCKDYGNDVIENLSPPLRSMNNDGSKANGGGQVAVAFDLRGREHGAQFEGPHDTANIRAASGGSLRSYVMQDKVMAVRRLTPRECERLQGFPDDYTKISALYTADGPRYKALGNTMAVPVMRWIGQRINMMEEIYGSQNFAR